MKLVIAAAFALLVFSGATAVTAGNPSLCARDGWTSAQSASGEQFTSMKDCAKAREVFQPELTISPSAVGAGETFTLTATGFPSGATLTWVVSVPLRAPFIIGVGTTDADGMLALSWFFPACGFDPPHIVTVSVRDSNGVHASATMTLC